MNTPAHALLGAVSIVRGPAKGPVIQHDGQVGVFIPIKMAQPNWTDEAVRLRVERSALRGGVRPAPPEAEAGPKAFHEWWLTVMQADAIDLRDWLDEGEADHEHGE